MLDLALVKVLAVHAVAATLALVHVRVCCVVGLEVLFAQGLPTRREVTVAVACPVTGWLFVVELVATRLQAGTATQSLWVPPSLGDDETLRQSLRHINTIGLL